MMDKSNKKAQAEFFGLVIIVFLLSIGLVFLVSLNKGEKESVKSTYMDQVLPQDFINSMLNMRTECRNVMPGIKMSRLITDCAERGEDSGITCTDGRRSCQYVSETIEFLLNNTLEEWQKSYYFNISGTNIEFYTDDPIKGVCNPERKVDKEPPGTQPIPTRSGFSMILLIICKI